MTTARPKRRHRSRRLLQFSLRALLIFVLLVSIGMSWVAVRMEKARRQKEAVEVIEEAGGHSFYRSPKKNGFADLLALNWARALFGDDFFSDVVEVSVYPKDFGTAWFFDDDEAAYLRGLPSLTRLRLNRTAISDAGLEHLEGLTDITDLDLRWNKVTDAGLEHLRGMTNLRKLRLDGTEVTPEGVKKLQEALPECEIVY